jgi:CIC family chloride channel protein
VVGVIPGWASNRPGSGLRALALRSREVVFLSAAIGAVAGLGVLAGERVFNQLLFEAILDAPTPVQVGAPLVGLILTALILRFLAGGASPATTDIYIQAMPEPTAPFPMRPYLGRLLAAFTTLGFGGSAGYEGPSIYLGAGVGAATYNRLSKRIAGLDRHVLLAAGAAAGVAAIFKAPATGAVFALEVPFEDDVAPRALLPAMIGAASGYLAYAAFEGTAPLIPVAGTPPLDGRDLAAAAAIGIMCGGGARLYAFLIQLAKRTQDTIPPMVRAVVGGCVLSLLVVVSHLAFEGEPLTMGPGYRAIEWALDPTRGLAIIALLATVRAIGTVVTLGGGAGGLFVPLVVQGALSGRLIAGIVGGPQSLFVVVGIAAFLGAGYRVPLAAVVFVAEATGRPGYIVPGLIAAVVAQLVMGEASVTAYQRPRPVTPEDMGEPDTG